MPLSPHPSPLTTQSVDPRILRTKRLLIDAFVDLMREKAFDKISISEITSRATVNRATFYAHFADKYELADVFIREGFERTINEFVRDDETDTHKFLAQLFRASAQHRGSVHTECKTKAHSLDELRKFESLTETEMRDMLRLRIHSWLSQKLPTKSIVDRGHVELMSAVVSSALYAAVVHFNANRSLKDADVDSIVESIARTLS